MRKPRKWLFAAAAACMSAKLVWGLPPPPDDDDDKGANEVVVSAARAPNVALQTVMVTGMRVRQGGAQDANFFRGEIEQNRIPPRTLSPPKGSWAITTSRSGRAPRRVRSSSAVELKIPTVFLSNKGGAVDEQEYRYSNEQVMLVDTEYVFDYQVRGPHLVLRRPHSSARLDLRRLP